MKTVWSALLAKAERTLRDARLRLAEINRRRENALLQAEKVTPCCWTTTNSCTQFSSAITAPLK